MNGILGILPNTASVAIWAMIAASLLPMLFAICAKLLGGFKKEDNAHPRETLANMAGMAARANAAQQNSFESLPIFLASVLVAMLFFVPQASINMLAVTYVIIRIGYGIAYIINVPTLRSTLWALSIICCLMLFYLPIRLSF